MTDFSLVMYDRLFQSFSLLQLQACIHFFHSINNQVEPSPGLHFIIFFYITLLIMLETGQDYF